MSLSNQIFNSSLKEVNAENIKLYLACNSSLIKEAKLLLESGAGPSICSSKTPPPIWIAAKRGCLKMVVLLHMHKADIDQCYHSVSPLMIAVAYRKKKVIQYLLENGAKTELRDKKSKTVLHRACEEREKGMITIIRWLVQAGADVNALTSNGRTPTMLAAKKSNLETIQILVKAGADIDMESTNGIAFDYAMTNNHILTSRYLFKRMGSKHQKTRKNALEDQTVIKEDVRKNNTGTDETRMEETSISQVQTNFNAAMVKVNTYEDQQTERQSMIEQEITQDMAVSGRMEETPFSQVQTNSVAPMEQPNIFEDLTKIQQTDRADMIEQEITQDMAVSGRMEETSIGQVQTNFVAPMKQTNFYENLTRDQQTDNQDMFEAEMTQDMAVSCEMEEDTVNNCQTQQTITIVQTISTGMKNLAGQLGLIKDTLCHHIAKRNEKGMT